MSESRVARWRERLRSAGKKAITVWLSADEELRLKDLAATWHTSPSAIMQQALEQFHPGNPPRLSASTVTSQCHISHDTDMSQHHRSDASGASQIQAYLQAELPAMVRGIVEQLALDTLLTGPRDSDVADTEDEEDLDDAVSEPPDTRTAKRYRDVAALRMPAQPQARAGRHRSILGQRILDLLREHPEGLSIKELRAYLKTERSIRAILAGMRRRKLIDMAGTGRQQSIGKLNGLFHRRRAPTWSPTSRHRKPPPSRSPVRWRVPLVTRWAAPGSALPRALWQKSV
jgi:hypothetical protein